MASARKSSTGSSGISKRLKSGATRTSDLILSDEVFVIGAEFLWVRPLITLRVQVVLAEFAHPFEHVLVVIVHQVLVFALEVRGVEGVVAQHIEAFFRQIVFGDMVDVLIVSP